MNNTSVGESADTSAVVAFRFPTVFFGYNTFEGNTGGGITLLNTRMTVRNGSTLLFLRNTAVFGGGISMDDRCLVSPPLPTLRMCHHLYLYLVGAKSRCEDDIS